MISSREYASTRNVRLLFGDGRFLLAGTNVQAGRDCEKKNSRRVCVGYITFSNFGGLLRSVSGLSPPLVRHRLPMRDDRSDRQLNKDVML